MPNNPRPLFRPGWRSVPPAALIVCIAAPMLWVIGYALAYSLGGIGLLSDGWTTRHWQASFSAGGLKESLIFSPTIAAVATLCATAGALGFAVIAPQTRYNVFLLSLIGIPLATPGAVLAVIVYQVLNPGGFAARIAFRLGLINSPTDFPALVNDPYAIGILVAQFCGTWPLLTLFFLMTWTSARVDRYCRLAESLGASRRQSRWRIAVPMLLSRGRPVILLLFLLNLGSYEIPLLLGRQSPQMLSVLTQRRFGQFNLNERPEAFVLATTYLLLVGAGVVLLMNWRRRRA